MQDWIVRYERSLAGLVTCIGASVWFSSAAHAFDLARSYTLTIWELIAAAGILAAFFVSVLIWIYSAHRRLKLRQRRRAKFASSALNNMPHGIVMVDARRRMVFCNDRYLEIYRLSRSELRNRMPFSEVLALRKARGTFDGDPYVEARPGEAPDNYIRDIDDGRAIKVSRRWLPGGGFITVHEDFSEQRTLSRQLATTKSFLESVIDNIPVCVAVKNIDDGRYVLANRAFEQFSRFARRKIVGHRAEEIFTPQSAKAVVQADEEAIASPSGDLSMEVVVERGSQRRVLGARRVVARDETGDPKFLITLFEDVTEQRGLSKEVEETKKFLELVLDHIPTSVAVKRVDDRKYVLVNRHAEKFMGRSRQQMIGQRIENFDSKDRATFINHRDSTAIRMKGEVISEEYPVPSEAGLRLYMSRRVAILDDKGEPQYLIQTNEDVTDRRQTESRMAHMAYHDGLTDLPNRVAFVQALSQMIDACAGSDEFAVLSIDLDRFKEVNDVFGHEVGDKLLVEVSRRIQLAAQGAVVARLGGDEFGLIIDGVQPAAGKALAERLIETMQTEFVIDQKIIHIGVTAGVALFPHNGSVPAALLANADVALFRAKAQARGSVCVFEAEMDQQIRDRRAMHHELSQAIKNGELTLNYQPLAKIGKDVVGFEALVRWNHPTRGMVSPGVFIPLAEESGLIVEMGQWILQAACREAASWPRPLQIAVNLSPVQFLHGDLVSLVHSILLETGLSPGRLELEITEGVLIGDFDRSLALLRRLKALGVRIAMDDFGSGYSSLSYLQSFPFDKIKIDREFVMNLGRNAQSAAIIRAVIGLGHGLDVPIVAEGVETQEQLAFLASESCDQVQGYFIGKPAPIQQYAELVGHSRGTGGIRRIS
ncbi:EAL domain-containing protein [Bradyrhizobium sp. LHD-71]|uniref:EAL domain-containing protein n=1 Tax=Bradyrhizobium sp. LHD-71 TaxID=3072141 RepID=UPI00280F1853|nr:EAL domain-containing protein [Bradyrhizobium sp. LHD-71]MDQ8726927.1 EAL domain-containing protein [Bradyrhizobium sp. LHD-71]